MPHLGVSFTVTELAAAEQLVQLSGSSTESAVDEASTSPVSVAKPSMLMPSAGLDEEEDEIGPKRWRRRYRLITDVNASCVPIKVCLKNKMGISDEGRRRT